MTTSQPGYIIYDIFLQLTVKATHGVQTRPAAVLVRFKTVNNVESWTSLSSGDRVSIQCRRGAVNRARVCYTQISMKHKKTFQHHRLHEMQTIASNAPDVCQ